MVSKTETDISQIKKYLNGELDAKAMHQLERRAQDDPFLMDALEGYEKAGNNQQANLNELAERLKQRIEKKERRIIPWNMMAIAASVLVVLTIGGVWLYKSRPVNTPKIAAVVKPEVKTPPAATEPEPVIPERKEEIAALKPQQTTKPQQGTTYHRRVTEAKQTSNATQNTPALSEIASANAKNADEDTTVTDTTTPLNEVVVMGYVGHFKKEVTASQAQVSGVGAPAASQEKSANVNRQVSPKKLIKGKIIGKDSGLPLSGVSVKVSGTNIAAVTDIKGRFNLRADSNKTKLVIGYIGYQTLELNTRNPDSLQNIAMVPSTSSLNEIVVTGYQAQKKTDDTGITNAHPQAGWSAFKKYLENAVSPDAKTGMVKLSFKVDHDGTISDVKVLKGLSPATNQKAIDLINDGPDWAGNANGQPELVKVRVKFAQ